MPSARLVVLENRSSYWCGPSNSRFSTLSIHYTGGLRYPDLERTEWNTRWVCRHFFSPGRAALTLPPHPLSRWQASHEGLEGQSCNCYWRRSQYAQVPSPKGVSWRGSTSAGLPPVAKMQGEATAAELEPNVVFQRADITDDGDLDRLIHRVIATFGQLDFLVNNALQLSRFRATFDPH